MEKGGTTTYTLCSSCGDVNGESCLSGIDNAFANFGGLEAYTGVLDNGQRVMALGCIEGGAAIENVEANVEMPASYVEGYTLYQVGENGETKVDVSVPPGRRLLHRQHAGRRSPAGDGERVTIPPAERR